MSISKKIIIEAFPPNTQKSRLHVFEKSSVTVGRSYDCDVILEDGFISPTHIKIELDALGKDFIVTDLNSDNGTIVHKSQLSDADKVLASGQECKIGKTRLRIFSGQHQVEPTRRLNFGTKLQTLFDRALFSIFLLMMSIGLGTAYEWMKSDPKKFMDEGIYREPAGIAIIIVLLAFGGALSQIISHRKPNFSREISLWSIFMILLVGFEWLFYPVVYFYIPNAQVEMLVTGALIFGFCLCGGGIISYVHDGRLARKTMVLTLMFGLAIPGLLVVYSLGYNSSPQFPSELRVGDFSHMHLQSAEEFLTNAGEQFKTP